MNRPNVLLISIDTLRADHLSCHGYARPTTPNLDRLAAEGTRFSHAFGTAVWTPPAHGSMLTGLYPTQHGVVDENRLDDAVPTVAMLMARSGYRTFGVVNNSQVGPLTGLDRGHATFHEVWRGDPGGSVVSRGMRYLQRRLLEARGLNDHGAERSNRLTIDWLAANRGGDPLYAFVHYIEPHNPLGAPRPFRDRWVDPDRRDVDAQRLALVADNPLACFTDDLQMTEDELFQLTAMYDEEIAYTDMRIGELFDAMRDQGIYDDTLIVVTADHGEHFGEHGMYSHVASLHEPIVHVPLIVKFPGQGSSVVSSGLTQHVDIVPTILSHAGVEHPLADRLRGRVLQAAGGPGHEVVYAEWEGRVPYYVQKRLRGKDSSVCERFLRPSAMIRDRQYKLILHRGGETELYDLDADPGEQANLASTEASRLATMRERLESWHREIVKDAPAGSRYQIDPEIQKHLESLGYM